MRILSALALLLMLASCQKEIDWGIPGSGSDGDLLLRAWEITPATNDTTKIDLTWDAQKRLVRYEAHGNTNGVAVNLSYRITRQADGKISKIVSIPGVPMIDSIVYHPTYSGDKIQYVKSTTYNSFLPFEDSSHFTYNGSGQVSNITTHIAVLGMSQPVARRTFMYNASSDVSVEAIFAPNGLGGFIPASTNTYTYGTHKPAVKLGEESFIIFPVTAGASKELVKEELLATIGNSQTRTFSGQTYNNLDRPKKASIAITPQPPGYNLSVQYFYQ